MERDNPERIAARQHREKMAPVLKAVRLFLLVSFLGAVVYSLFFSGFLEIKNISVSGSQDLVQKELEQKIQSYYQGKYSRFVPKSNILLASEKILEGKLKDDFKKIESVAAEKKFPGTLSVRIAERKSLVVWCSGGPCYIIDQNGYAYQGVGLDSREATENNLVKIVDEGAKPVKLGEKIISAEYAGFFPQVREAFVQEGNFDIEDEYSVKSRVSGSVKIRSRTGFDIFLNSQIPASQSVGTLKIFLESELKPENISALEYVDLKVENKVYYKLKNVDAEIKAEGEPAISPETADEKKDEEESEPKKKEEKKKNG